MKTPWRLLLLCLVGCWLGVSACSDDEDTVAARPTLTYVTAVSGLGDNGYNDLIMQGVMTFATAHPEVAVSVRTPVSAEDARQVVEAWRAETASGVDQNNHLLLLGDTDYAPLLSSLSAPLGAHQRALLVEGDSAAVPIAGVSTLWIRRYGAAYLVGCLAREAEAAYVLAAYAGDTVADDAVQGFCDGYHDTSGRTAEVHYLADDDSGYAQADKAYRWLSDLGDSRGDNVCDLDAFIFPVAGGSNNGLYKYTRDVEITLFLLCGMDVDASEYSTRIPCSMVLHMDRVVNRLLTEWADSGTLPAHTELGLSNPEAIEVVASQTFFDRLALFMDYYIDPDYWTEGIARYYSLALAKEEVYEQVH